jgi:hypothetical protein
VNTRGFDVTPSFQVKKMVPPVKSEALWRLEGDGTARTGRPLQSCWSVVRRARRTPGAGNAELPGEMVVGTDGDGDCLSPPTQGHPCQREAQPPRWPAQVTVGQTPNVSRTHHLRICTATVLISLPSPRAGERAAWLIPLPRGNRQSGSAGKPPIGERHGQWQQFRADSLRGRR